MELNFIGKPGYWLIFFIGLLIIGCEKTTRLVSDIELNELSDSKGTYLLSRVRWITSSNGNIFVPELKDCLVFRIDAGGGLVDFVDLRELFGTFSLGQVCARDSMIYLINLTNRCLHILNIDFSEAGIIKMPHSQLNLGRLYFSNDGFTGFGAGKVLTYGYSGDTVTLLSAIPQNDSLMIRSGHIFKKGGYTYLVSE